MATYVLIHGAGDSGWYWHLLEAELRDRGHDVVAPDLPSDDDAAGLAEYADTVDDWWANTGYAQARREHDERNGARRTTSPSSSMTSPRTWPPRRCAGAGTSRPPGQPAVAAPGVAGRAHQVPALPRRPLLPRRVPPPGGAGPPGHRPGRDRRQPLRRPQPPSRAGRPPGVVPGRAVGRRVAGTGLRGLAFSAWPRRNRAAGSTQVPAGGGRAQRGGGDRCRWRVVAARTGGHGGAGYRQAAPRSRSTATWTPCGPTPSAAPRSSSAPGARDQLHPLVVPQDSQTKHDPAGRIRTPQVEQ